MGCDELLCLSLSIYGWRGKRGEVHHSQEIEAWSSNKKDTILLVSLISIQRLSV